MIPMAIDDESRASDPYAVLAREHRLIERVLDALTRPTRSGDALLHLPRQYP